MSAKGWLAMRMPEPDISVPSDAAEMARLVLAVSAAGGADARQLARDANLPPWAISRSDALIPARQVFRLWELAEHALSDSHVGLAAAGRHQLGDLDLYDYLFTTAATVKDGLEASGYFSRLVTTNGRLQVVAETDREITYCYEHSVHGGRGEELGLQFVVAGYCARIRAATGRLIVPARLAFTQSPPPSYRAFVEIFGTSQIDFRASRTTFTLRAADRDFQMPRADPVLARILRRYAESMPAPRQATWEEYFQELLDEVIDSGDPSLDAVADRLAVSRRTLQRHLAEHGTTWRAELDAARRRRAERAREAGPPGMSRLAREMGYADPRSARRALRRWSQSDDEPESSLDSDDVPRQGREAEKRS